MMDATGSMTLICGKDTALLLSTQVGERPHIIYWGRLFAGFDGAQIALLSTRQQYFGGPTEVVHATLSCELGSWGAGPPGLIVHRAGQDWMPDLRVSDVCCASDHEAIITCTDSRAALSASYALSIDPATGLLSAETTIQNLSDQPLGVDWCAPLCLPLDDRMDGLTAFTGKWAGEFERETVPLGTGSYVRENRSGRTSHDNFPGLLATSAQACERSGVCAAFHLGWSGNHRLRVDRQPGGQAVVQMGELLLPGEITLARGETYTTPVMYGATGETGLSRLSQRFHSFLTGQVLDRRISQKPRPVHFNTWEAVYFNHSMEKLLDLADLAASVGAERFVLDDGWFGQRRSDVAGLGDWVVSADIYPDGLGALADRVRELGMEFGIWFEPEMVNPDSDLFRQHPDWILGEPGHETTPFRNQLTLDLTRPEVGDYLFNAMDAIVREYGVSYIKWDMNRQTLHPASQAGDCQGRAVMHCQTHALYTLMARLRAAHPGLELESCASGGGRADYGILHHADRIWTSDNNDARSRQSIQRGASFFFPLSITGSHVGPATCHITRRTLPMAMRAATAIFGHMGMEVDLACETEADRAILAAAVALYKQHRGLLHGGLHYRIDTPPFLSVSGVVSAAQDEAIFSCALTDTHSASLPPRIRFDGLNMDATYRLQCVWPQENPSITGPSIMEAAALLDGGSVFSGAALVNHGLQLPLLYPDTCLILYLQSVDRP